MRHRTEVYLGLEGRVDELAAMLACLDGRHPNAPFTRLAALFGDDFAAFMLVFGGERIEVPSRAYLERLAFYCRVWVFVKVRGSDAAAVSAAAGEFDIPEGRVTSICEMVGTMLERRQQCRTDEQTLT